MTLPRSLSGSSLTKRVGRFFGRRDYSDDSEATDPDMNEDRREQWRRANAGRTAGMFHEENARRQNSTKRSCTILIENNSSAKLTNPKFFNRSSLSIGQGAPLDIHPRETKAMKFARDRPFNGCYGIVAYRISQSVSGNDDYYIMIMYKNPMESIFTNKHAAGVAILKAKNDEYSDKTLVFDDYENMAREWDHNIRENDRWFVRIEAGKGRWRNEKCRWNCCELHNDTRRLLHAKSSIG